MSTGLLGDILAFIDRNKNTVKKRGIGGLLGDAALSLNDAGALLGKQYPVDPLRGDPKDIINHPASQAAMNMSGGLWTAYHGSPHKFDKFDVSKAGSTTDEGALGRGLYFSTDRRVAEASPHRYTVDVEPKQPLRISLPNLKTDKRKVVREALGLPAKATADDITRAAAAKGYDSVLLDYSPAGYKHQEVVMFDPDAVKILERQ